LEGAGDVDGDGVDDLIVGQSGYDDTYAQQGQGDYFR
jgi:hypothetical protein